MASTLIRVVSPWERAKLSVIFFLVGIVFAVVTPFVGRIGGVCGFGAAVINCW